MSNERKNNIICPCCGANAPKLILLPDVIYKCTECTFVSTAENCIDISYKDDLSAPLSNLFPHSFSMYSAFKDISWGRALITYPSMETFLQSIKIKDDRLQYDFVQNYSATDAKKMSGVLDAWKKDHMLYFDGKAYDRFSKEYTELITKAFDALYETNPIFRKLVLPRFKDYIIIHSLGSDDPAETVLTEAEFRYQINRLIAKSEK